MQTTQQFEQSKITYAKKLIRKAYSTGFRKETPEAFRDASNYCNKWGRYFESESPKLGLIRHLEKKSECLAKLSVRCLDSDQALRESDYARFLASQKLRAAHGLTKNTAW